MVSQQEDSLIGIMIIIFVIITSIGSAYYLYSVTSTCNIPQTNGNIGKLCGTINVTGAQLFLWFNVIVAIISTIYLIYNITRLKSPTLTPVTTVSTKPICLPPPIIPPPSQPTYTVPVGPRIVGHTIPDYSYQSNISVSGNPPPILSTPISTTIPTVSTIF